MLTNDTLTPAAPALARRFVDSCYDRNQSAPDCAGMQRLRDLGLVVEVAPGWFAETAALRAAGL